MANLHQNQFTQFCDIAKKILGDDIKCIIEIGARDCKETLEFSRQFPQATIYAFECNPETLPMCRNSIIKKDKIHLIEAAVSDKSGTLNFYQIDTEKTKTDYPGGNPGASSLFKSSGKYPLEEYIQRRITVNSITLQDFFKKNNITTTDLLWMDIQGAELKALNGAEEKISHIKMIHLEVGFFEIYEGQPLFGDIRSFLKKKGFSLLTFTHCGRYSGDAIFIRKDILKQPSIIEHIVMLRFLTKHKIRQIIEPLRKIFTRKI